MIKADFGAAEEVDKRLPSYVRLRDGLAGRIARGDWKPDVTLPSENQLAAETGLSVGTVRKAMQMLVDEGLLERRQGAGTFLNKRAFDTSLFRFFAVTTGDGAPIIPTSRLIARTRVGALAAVSHVLGTEDCIRIDRVRSHSDQVLLTEEIWIAHHRFDGFETLAEAGIGPLLYPLYLERFQVFIANAVDDVSFARASDAVAGRLGIAPGDPTAVIERTAFAVDGTAVEWRVAQRPAERFRYRSRLT